MKYIHSYYLGAHQLINDLPVMVERWPVLLAAIKFPSSGKSEDTISADELELTKCVRTIMN